MQRIFITGGTGFFGKSILDYRLRHPEFLADAEITILSRHPDAFVAANPKLAQQPGIRFVAGDVRTFSTTDFTDYTDCSTPQTPDPCNPCNPWLKPAPSAYVPIVTRAETELGLSVKVPLADAIRLSTI